MSDYVRTLQSWYQQTLETIRDASPKVLRSPSNKALLVGALVGLVAFKLARKRYRLPPGPFALPLLGNLLSMRGSRESFYVTLRRWARDKYGPVVRVYFGPTLCVTLNDADVATEALVKKAEDFAGRPYMYSMHTLTEGSRDIAMSDYTASWKLHRKIAVQALRHYMSGPFLEKVVHQAADMVTEKMAQEPGPFDPHRYNSSLMFFIMEAICFGGGVKPFDDPRVNKILDLFEKVAAEFGNGFFEDIFPPLRYCPTPKFRRIWGWRQEFLDELYNSIAKHRETFSPDNIRDLTDSILLAQSEAEREERPEVMAMFTDTHVGETIADMFAAGVDSSRITLDWALLYMAGHPKIQRQAQEEIDSVTGSRLPDTRDRNKLPFTQAVVYETLRLGVVAPTALPHKTLRDTTVAGYDIPKDTMVLVNQWAVLHDPKKWDEPEEFKPERFLDEKGNMKRLDCWTPFSAGRRVCLGESVAKPELLLILSCLLKRFTISLPEGVVYDPGYNTGNGMNFHVPNSYKVVVKRR